MPRTLAASRPRAGQTFDDVLGSADRRYFASGYRRTGYDFPAFEVQSDEPQQVSGVARVDYADDWSRKQGVSRIAHLSTADAVVLAADAAQTSLALVLGLSADEIGESWFKELSVRTGARPVLALDDVPVRCRLTRTLADQESDLLLKIGTFTVTAVVRHPPATAVGRGAAPIPAGRVPTLYTHGFRDVTHSGVILEVDAEAPAIECHTKVSAGPAQSGIESGRGVHPTLVDCLVFAGQMLQLLICAKEGTTRDGFGNLWLRRITFTTAAPERPLSSRARMWVTDSTVVSRADDVLHSLDVRCDGMFGTSMRGQAAYSGQPG